MAKTSVDEVQKMAALARIQLNSEEANEMKDQFDKILGYLDQVAGVNCEGVEPMCTPVELEGILREDEVNSEFTSEQMLENAPDKIGNLFKVPPAI